MDDAGFVGLFTSLAVDAGGRLHVSYYHADDENLKYIE